MIDLEPGDCVSLVVDGQDLSATLVAGTFRGNSVDFEAVIGDVVPDTRQLAADSGRFPTQTVNLPGDTVAEFLDLPMLTGEMDAGNQIRMFAALSGTSLGWRGARVYLSADHGSSYSGIGAQSVPAIMGVADHALAPASPSIWDRRNELIVSLFRADQSLESVSETALLNGANLALLGDEIIQFRRAELLEDGQYRLFDLLRGRRGTEWAISSHLPDEQFVLLRRPDLLSVTGDLARLGQNLLVKAVSFQQAVDQVPPQIVVPKGRAQRPFSPAHISAERKTNGDWSLGWIRRVRFGGDWLDGTDVPLGEETERYAISLSQPDGTIQREIVQSSTSLTYSAEQQMTDAGGPVASIQVDVAQMSATVGRGDAARALF